MEYTHNLYIPAFYLMLFGIIGLVAAVVMTESAKKPLRGAMPMAADQHEAKELLAEYHDTLEEKISELDEKIDELQQKRQVLANEHPHID